MPQFTCSLGCGSTFKTRTWCVKHEWTGVCLPARHVPEEVAPYIVLDCPERPPKRSRKRSVGEMVDLVTAYEISGVDKTTFCSKNHVEKHQLRGAIRAVSRLERKEGIDLTSLTPKQRKSRSLGSGEIADSMKVINADMSARLLQYTKTFRGPAPEGHIHHSREDMILYKDGTRLGVTVLDLVDQLAIMSDDMDFVFDSISEETWARRVRDWCRQPEIGLSRRAFNQKHTSLEKRQILAERCKGTLSEISQIMKAESIKPCEVANITGVYLYYISSN